MQTYYNSISTARRIAFIDNLDNTNAKKISQQYNYIVCFSSKENVPIIWYQGKAYGQTEIDENNKSVKINGYEISLGIDNNTGKIGLFKKSLITDGLLYYIGSYNNIIGQENIYLSDSDVNTEYTIENNQFKNSWIKIPENNFIDLTTDILQQEIYPNIDDFVIIIPNEFQIFVPIYDSENNPVVIDSTLDQIGNISVNDHTYNVYKYTHQGSIVNNLILKN